jgi:GNAT superfamily N-acetyltransferase
MGTEAANPPIFSTIEPVLPVRDIRETINYWQEVLGFPSQWTWGDPPNIGAVSWQNVHVQFYQPDEWKDGGTLAGEWKDGGSQAGEKGGGSQAGEKGGGSQADEKGGGSQAREKGGGSQAREKGGGSQVREWKSGGSSVWIRLQRLESLYRLHQERKADIVEPLERKPWGLSQYMVREINGHYLCFAGLIEEREKSLGSMPPTVRIVGRVPGVKEFQRLQVSVGWGKEVVEAKSPTELAAVDAMTEKVLAAAIFGVVAMDTVSGDAVGCALLLGDGVSYYYVKDVMVHKNWQGRRIGTALMQGLTDWLGKNARKGALVGLFTRDGLEPFYKQFGFANGFAMLRYMDNK